MPLKYLLILGLFPPIAGGAAVSHPFYDEKAKGWFWKERVPEPQVTSNAPPLTSPDTPPPSPPRPEDTPLSSAWFRAHLGAIRDEALDDPSPEKVRRFFMLQKALLDKAERFAASAQSVVLQNPELDERTRHPTTPAAKALHHQVTEARRQEALRAMGRQAGLVFIVRSDCRYCHLMAPLVAALAERMAIRLYPVSLDGGDVPGLKSDQLIKDPLIGEKLKLKSTPALFLMVPQKGLYPVLEGSASALELEAHLYEIGRIAGLISNVSLDP